MKHGEVGSERASRVSERSDMPSYSKRRLHFYLGNDKSCLPPFLACTGG